MNIRLLSTLFAIALSIAVYGQDGHSKLYSKNNDFRIKPVFAFQQWTYYSFGSKLIDRENGLETPIPDRLRFNIRRSNFGIKGEPFHGVSFNFTAALDFIGRDIFDATVGGNNRGGNPRFRAWNAFMRMKLTDGEKAVVTLGYFSPYVGRASKTSAILNSSFEKSWSQNYIRRFMVGIGPGRATGVNLGGFLFVEDRVVNFTYDVGMFNATSTTPTLEGNQVVLNTRVAFHFFEPEFGKYAGSMRTNHFGERNGFTIGATATRPAARKFMYGVDWIGNLGPVNFDGEYMILQTSSIDETMTVKAPVGFLRLTYNIAMENGKHWEPAIMYTFFRGATDGHGVGTSDEVGLDTGHTAIFNVGLNYWLSRKIKFGLHYTQNSGRMLDNGEIANNTYYRQSGIAEGFSRGSLVGFEINFVL